MANISEHTISPERSLEALHPHLEAICKIADALGVSLAVSHDGKLIYRTNAGFAELKIKEDITGSTQLAIGIMARTSTVATVGAVVDCKTGDVESVDGVRLVCKTNDGH
jgi:hypothetical protein